MSAILDSELWEWIGLLTILLHLLEAADRSGPGVSRLGLRPFGRSLKVSLKNVVISCRTKQAIIFKAYGHEEPVTFTVPEINTCVSYKLFMVSFIII